MHLCQGIQCRSMHLTSMILPMMQRKQHHARLLQRCLKRRADLGVVSCLRAWQAVAQYKLQRRVALMRLLSKHLLNRKRHAFHRYIVFSMLMDQHALRCRLQSNWSSICQACCLPFCNASSSVGRLCTWCLHCFRAMYPASGVKISDATLLCASCASL